MKLIITLLFVLLFLSACVVQPIKPWHRDVLARDDMQLDYDEQIDAMDDQTVAVDAIKKTAVD